jgi:hypothetical protein
LFIAAFFCLFVCLFVFWTFQTALVLQQIGLAPLLESVQRSQSQGEPTTITGAQLKGPLQQFSASVLSYGPAIVLPQCDRITNAATMMNVRRSVVKVTTVTKINNFEDFGHSDQVNDFFQRYCFFLLLLFSFF